jgi:hypothetical protein
LIRKLLAVVLTLILACWLLQGCASSDSKITPATASTLQRDVAAVVSAADASRWDAAIDALDRLQADVESAQAAGQLSDERAAQISAVRQRVLEDLHRIRLSSPTPGPATATQITPSTESDDDADDDGGSDGHGGKAKDDDQGEDGGGKHKDDDQGEDGGKSKENDQGDQGEDGGGKHKGENNG